MSKNYVNYHTHSYYSNVMTPDCTISNRDRALRAKELGQGAFSVIEHGWAGRFIEGIELGKELGLKPIIGSEAYFVKDRFSNDATNAHIVILAKNESGRKELNLSLSEANLTGYYYKPRLDLELLQNLSPENVWVTTACPGGVWKYGEESEEILLVLHKHFQNSLFLEVQTHNTDVTKHINQRILSLSGRYGIKIIAGMDSHMIYESQAEERDGYLASRGISYPEEEGWYLDYPDYDVAFKRFDEQGVLNKYKIEEALDTTNILLNVEEYNSIIFDEDLIKLPTLYPNKSLSEKNQILSDLIMKKWGEEKENLPLSAHSHYEEEIEKELDVVFKTGMADYFLLDYEIINRGVDKGGSITMTARGSASSFYLSKLLGFTTIDRISSSVRLFPERFISVDRLLETKNLPDIDFNLGTPEVFAEAQKEVLGDNHTEQMITFGTVQSSGAWKMHARNAGIDFDTANHVSNQIKKYEKAIIHADADDALDKEDLNELDFIEPKYHGDFLESRKYLGLVNSISVHPCAHLLFNHGNIKEEFGLIKTKTGNIEHICVCCDGLFAETYKMLKNDLLKVSVVDLIHRVYKKIGVEPHHLPELIELCKDNEKVWEIYANGWTMGVNQVEPHSATSKVVKYKPKNISELSAFVAAIRPGFQSYYQRFEDRESFEYGVKSLDNLIQTKEFPHSYMLYQENAMQVMAYAGIPMSETYDAIKNIAKKRAEKVLSYQSVFVNGITKRIVEEDGMSKDVAKRIARETWQVIEDSSRYSFNACVSGDTLIGRPFLRKGFQATVEEMFLIKTSGEYARETQHVALRKRYSTCGYGESLSLCKDGKIRKNNIADVRFAGIQNIYRIEAEDGAYIDCTANHRIPTDRGILELKDILVGDRVFVKGKYVQKYPKRTWLSDSSENNYPKKGEVGFQKKKFSPTNFLSDLRNEMIEKKAPCGECQKDFSENERFELHHIDGKPQNNTLDNLVWICVSCHKKAHYKMGRTKAYEAGLPSVMKKVVSIKFLRKDRVYDIEMEAPYHNFVSKSGMIVCNSHAYSMAGDSLYGAYLKSHYPIDFYETLLRIYEEDGDKDRIAKARVEAEKAYGIKFPSFRFGQDNREIVAEKEKNQITSSLKTIKGFGKATGKNLYEISKAFEGGDFVDLLVFAEERNQLSSKWEKLIKINYFEEFGGNVKLLKIFEEFRTGKNRYSRKYVEKTKEQRTEALRDLLINTYDEKMDFIDQIKAEQEILGFIHYTNEKMDKRYFLVTDLDTRYAPRLQAYCLATGRQESIKVQTPKFKDTPFEVGDVIYGKRFEKKNPLRYIDGKFVENPEGEPQWWLASYSVVQYDTFKEILEKV